MTDCFQHDFHTSGNLPCPQCDAQRLINQTWAIALPMFAFVVVFFAIILLAVLTQK